MSAFLENIPLVRYQVEHLKKNSISMHAHHVLISIYCRHIIWLCLTKTGNYRIHEFDWLKSILTAV